jgi:uncharacterized membrane protein
MKRTFAGLAIIACSALIGCNQGTSGGPGTTGAQPTFGQADNTFNLTVPMMSSSLQQGDTEEATIGIKRATNFDQDVTLTFSDIPQGVTIEPSDPVIKSGATEAKVSIKADDDASLGDFKVKVTGQPADGSEALVDFKLTIAAKDSFSLNMPSSSTLTQGTTQTVSFGVTRDPKFDQDVTLKFGEMPTGVTAEPSEPVLKHGEATTPVTLTAADNASLGDFAIKVTGHPAKGADASNDFKLNVRSSEVE